MKTINDNNNCVWCGEKCNTRLSLMLETLYGEKRAAVSLCEKHIDKSSSEIREVIGRVHEI